MGYEIERRFLLNGFPALSKEGRATKIEQGYFELSSAFDSLRVRVYGNKSAVITLKDGRGIIRQEDEEKISLGLAEKLLKKAQHRLVKLRINHLGWEIDVMGDALAGIILAEKELEKENEKIVIPGWLSPFVVREVTDSLTNLHLARLASDLKGTNLPAGMYLEDHLRIIKKYVLTGGPCSGKSTIMEILKSEFPEYHFVPEVATIVIGQLGVHPGSGPLSQKRFQQTIYKTQKLFEATSVQFAISQNKKAVIFDRGSMDGAAYVPGGAEEFEMMTGAVRTEEFRSYDSVIYLKVPPAEIYLANMHNNPARKEDYQEAEALGNKIYEVWKDHPAFYRADSNLWEEKVETVKKVIRP